MTWHHPALAPRTINALDDEIAKLRAENERLREALRPFAAEVAMWEATNHELPPERMLMFASDGGGTFLGIDVRTLYNARAALDGVNQQGPQTK